MFIETDLKLLPATFGSGVGRTEHVDSKLGRRQRFYAEVFHSFDYLPLLHGDRQLRQ